MSPKWENRLGGAQQFMSTHCFAMAQSGRVDPTGTGITSKQYICIQITAGNNIQFILMNCFDFLSFSHKVT